MELPLYTRVLIIWSNLCVTFYIDILMVIAVLMVEYIFREQKTKNRVYKSVTLLCLPITLPLFLGFGALVIDFLSDPFGKTADILVR